MNTRVKRQKEYIVVSIEGKVDYETQDPMKEQLLEIISDSKRDLTPKKIIMNFEDLQFVGSCGISQFVQILKEFNSKLPSRPCYYNVSSEFRKIIQAFDEEKIFAFFDDDSEPGISH